MPPAARNRLNLIEQITADAVASDYVGSVVEPGPASRRQRVLVAAIAAAVAGLVLALGVSARILNAPVVDDQRAALVERVNQADARQAELAASVADLHDQVARAQAAELATVQGGAALAVQIRRYELATGLVAVQGPGVVVTLTDAAEDGSDQDDLGKVLDSDVQTAVNGLWQAGAEAVAVNDQRLTARSAIRSAAGAILVNYRPLRPPYLVRAIGDPDTLAQRFGATADAAELSDVSTRFGIGFETESVAAVGLPAAATAPLDQPVARPVEEGEGR